jgi:geranylgeranyl diphosphate synthase type I
VVVDLGRYGRLDHLTVGWKVMMIPREMSILDNYLLAYKERVDREIEAELERRLEEVKSISPHLVPIVQSMQELSVGGKRLRAMLTILGYEIEGKVADEQVIKAAAMMEIFHLGLLIQDDFMDRDTLRRGVKTILARYDDPHTANFVSMLAGDYTFGWGMEIISNLDLPTEKLNKAISVWGKYFTRVGYGQTLDGLAVADEASILKILELKSGEYSCVLPLTLGATLAGADPKTITMLEEFGKELGWVFQLRDDWLSEYGDSDKTGKPVGNDRREGKHSFATMHTKEETEIVIKDHMSKARSLISGFLSLSGDSLPAQAGRKVMEEIVTWLGSREN